MFVKAFQYGAATLLLKKKELEMWSGKPLNFDTTPMLLLQLPLHRFFAGSSWPPFATSKDSLASAAPSKRLHENTVEDNTITKNKHLAKRSQLKFLAKK